MRRPLFAVLCGAAAAVWLTILFIHWSPGDYEKFRGSEICLEGTVCGLEPKIEGDSVVWRMTLAGISFLKEPSSEASLEESIFSEGDCPALGRRDCVICVLEREPALQMSARVRVRGKVYPFRSAMNEGEFDARLYYHILRVEFQLRDTQILAVSAPADRPAAFLYKCKKSMSSIIDRTFSNQNSPVVKAMLLGEKGLLEEETKELYQGAGIIHILSISGLHLSLLGMGLFLLLGKIRIPLGRLFFGNDREKQVNSNMTVPLPLRAGASILLVCLYGKMTGMGTSAFRALVMLSLFLIAKAIGRTYDLLTAAAIAWTLLLFDQPLYLLHTGFQFSFCAVLSMGILVPALPGRALKGLAIPLGTLPVYMWNYGTFPLYSLLLNLVVIPLMGVVMVSGGAAVFIGGAVLYPARIVGLAGMAPAAFEGAVGQIGDAVLFPARITGLPAELILNLYRFLASITGKLPGHTIIMGKPAPVQIFLYYFLLLAFAGLSAHLRSPAVRRRIEHSAGKADTPLRIISGAGWKAALHRIGQIMGNAAAIRLRDNRERKIFGTVCSALWLLACVIILTFRLPPAFEMDFLYVGQGDGIFITSGGRNFLIDGGSTSNEGLVKYTLIPFFHCKGIRRLDAVMITHEDKDHCSGVLELLEAAAEGHPDVRIGAVYLTDISDSSKGDNYHLIEELAGAAKIPVCRISRGDCLRSKDLSFQCLHPAKGAEYEDANQSSMTLLMEYGKNDPEKDVYRNNNNSKNEDMIHKEFSALLTGDLEGQGETDLKNYLPGTTLQVDLLKVAHHGSRGATGEAFLDKVTFNTAVISAGINNMYGHPHKELLERIEQTGADCYRTDREGEISVKKERRGKWNMGGFLGSFSGE